MITLYLKTMSSRVQHIRNAASMVEQETHIVLRLEIILQDHDGEDNIKMDLINDIN
jgi:hypothetical protein